MEVGEGPVTYVVRVVKDVNGRELEEKLRRSLPDFKPPFKRHSHGDAVRSSTRTVVSTTPRSELTWECEKLLSGLHAQLFFIYDYP